MNNNTCIPADQFHAAGGPVSRRPVGSAVFKPAADMACVQYTATHFNPAYPEGDARRGFGSNCATWIFSEEPGLAEGVFETGLELFMEARFAPGTAVGLHTHTRTEEVYYLLEGSLEMTVVEPDGRAATQVLRPGDAHAVRLGQAHYGQAGAEGARFICVAVRKT